MPLLFSYGTLQDESVQQELFGRTLIAHKDSILGYEQFIEAVQDPAFVRTSGKAEHAILRPSTTGDSAVEGTALEVTEAELEHADQYEPVEYTRVLAKLRSGGEAWVYVDARFREGSP